MTFAMIVMMICSTFISQTSNSSSSGSRWARTKTKTFLKCNRQNLFRTAEKSWKSRTVWSQWSGKEYFFRQSLIIFPVLQKLTHMYISIYISVPPQQFMLSSLAGHIWRNCGSHLQRGTKSTPTCALNCHLFSIEICHSSPPTFLSCVPLSVVFQSLPASCYCKSKKIGVGNRKRKIENVKSETGHKLAPGEG